MKASFTIAWLVAAGLLTGCASTMSGVGGASQYACKAPEGTVCTSVSGVYANAASGASRQEAPGLISPSMQSGAPPDAPYSEPRTGSLRSNPRILRLWIAPWEDADGDLHEEAVVHVIVDTGRWLIEHVRPEARIRLDAVTPPRAQPDGSEKVSSQPAASSTPRPPAETAPAETLHRSPTER
jgi:conjugal transfer pilus assembly protein TraV